MRKVLGAIAVAAAMWANQAQAAFVVQPGETVRLWSSNLSTLMLEDATWNDDGSGPYTVNARIAMRFHCTPIEYCPIVENGIGYGTYAATGEPTHRAMATRWTAYSPPFWLSFDITAGDNAVTIDQFIYRGQQLDVPEPATWAMVLGGLGLIGSTMRRRNALRSAEVPYHA